MFNKHMQILADIPRDFIINGNRWYILIKSVEEEEHLEGASGLTHYGKEQNIREIYINKNCIKDIETVRSTLLHEVLHAIGNEYPKHMKKPKGSRKSDWEHYYIYLYEYNLRHVMQDNPALSAFLFPLNRK